MEKSAKVASNAWKTGKTGFQWLENPAKAKGRGTRMSEGKREGNFQKNVHGVPKKIQKNVHCVLEKRRKMCMMGGA